MTDRSPKSYLVAVSLSGVFGILGIHHFYLRRWLHGLIDLLASIVGLSLIIFSNDPALIITGYLILGLDFLHTLLVTFWLIVGEYRDGDGLLVKYPGQK